MTNTRITTGIIVAAAAAIVLTACNPSPPTPTPTPPSSVTTPSSTLTQKEQDYAAAANAYDTANRLVDEALVRGDATIPADVADFADPKGTWYQRQVQGFKDGAGSRREGLSVLAAAFPTPESAYTDTKLEMYICNDARAVTVHDKSGKKIGQGTVVAGDLEFVRNGPAGPDGQPRWRVGDYGTADEMFTVDHCEEAPR